MDLSVFIRAAQKAFTLDDVRSHANSDREDKFYFHDKSDGSSIDASDCVCDVTRHPVRKKQEVDDWNLQPPCPATEKPTDLPFTPVLHISPKLYKSTVSYEVCRYFKLF
jgi:hypothetical protein